MNQRDLKTLERLFVSEIHGLLPFQKIGPKHAEKLESEGLIQGMEKILPGRFPMLIKGWQLTHLGRMSYCSTCEDEEPA